MIDITSIGQDINLFDTQAPRAANIFSVQVGSLEYAPDLGIDLSYFLNPEFNFQNEAFKAHLIQVLASNGINVASLDEHIQNLFEKFVFNLVPIQTGTGLMAR